MNGEFLIFCNIQHETYRNVKFKCLKFNQYTEILKEYFKIFFFGVDVVGDLTEKDSPVCVMITYSAVIHLELMT